MADPPKTSGSTFSFGGGGSGLFGSGNTSGGGGSGLFGSSNTSGGGGGLFGSASTPASGTSMFGTPASSAPTSTPSSVAAAPSSSAPGFSFSSFSGGSAQASNPFAAATGTSSSAPSFPLSGTGGGGDKQNQGSALGVSPFSGFTTPNKPGSNETSTSGSKSLFGLGGNSGTGGTGGLFGTSSAAAGTTTPAPSKPPSSLFSTTPAGPPPGTGIGTGGIIGSQASQSASTSAPSTNLFGSGPSQTASQQNPGSIGFPNLFANAEKPASTLFSPKPQSASQSSVQAAVPQTSTSGGLSNLLMPPMASSTEATSGSTTTSAPGPGLFTMKPPASSAQPGTGLFSTPSITAQSTASPSGSISSAPLFPAPAVNTFQPISTNAPASAAPAALGATTSSQPVTPAAASLFNKPASTALQTARNATAAPAAPPTAGPSDASKAPNLTASTAGPKPTSQSRLKNKSMDEILTTWASDLTKYQKEFQKQAEKVAEWDNMLVDNSEKIQKLYGSTLEAERATIEVERQLSSVENDQAELEYWLDHYEKQVDELISNQVGQGDSLQGPDQERERTYKLAEKLSDRLDEMGKDLVSMAEEINASSSALDKTGKADDPLSQIVRVLNGHLTQLQQIDQGTAALQKKINTAQEASRNVGGFNGVNGPGNDAVNDFYRSYMGRR